jgi:hypothetical protein
VSSLRNLLCAAAAIGLIFSSSTAEARFPGCDQRGGRSRGPSIALSLEACLLGDLDLELRAQGTAFPSQHVDAQAGLAGGWRGLYLNDAGLVDGVEHADGFSGPYVGLGFSF